MSVYYVAPSQTTPEEPHSGYYYVKDTDDGEVICGPFITRPEALDDMSDGAYSSWVESKRDEADRQDIIDAGRGHLLRHD